MKVPRKTTVGTLREKKKNSVKERKDDIFTKISVYYTDMSVEQGSVEQGSVAVSLNTPRTPERQ